MLPTNIANFTCMTFARSLRLFRVLSRLFCTSASLLGRRPKPNRPRRVSNGRRLLVVQVVRRGLNLFKKCRDFALKKNMTMLV